MQAKNPDKPLEELVLRASDDDPAVCGLKVLERHETRMRRLPGAMGEMPPGQVPGCLVIQHAYRGLEQRDIAVHADPGALRRMKSRH